MYLGSTQDCGSWRKGSSPFIHPCIKTIFIRKETKMRNALVLLIALLLTSCCLAKTTHFIVANSDWDDPNSWDNGVPTNDGTDDVYITVDCSANHLNLNTNFIFVYASTNLIIIDSNIITKQYVYLAASDTLVDLTNCYVKSTILSYGTFSAAGCEIVTDFITGSFEPHNCFIYSPDWKFGDFNFDGAVNFEDFSRFADSWLQ